MMFVVSLTYTQSLDAVDALLSAHIAYLEQQYKRGVFLLSGPKIPRSGGVILARADSKEALMSVLAEDPFNKGGVASYDVVEFKPTKSSQDAASLLE